MNIDILKLHEDAVIPTYGSDGAACFDLYAVEAAFIQARSRSIVRTGLAFDVPTGYALDVRSRSGLAAKHGIVAFHGTLDSDYRGELIVLLFNHSNDAYGVQAGERIAQARITASPKVTFWPREQLSLTERGAAGFGSTGKT